MLEGKAEPSELIRCLELLDTFYTPAVKQISYKESILLQRQVQLQLLSSTISAPYWQGVVPHLSGLQLPLAIQANDIKQISSGIEKRKDESQNGKNTMGVISFRAKMPITY